MSKDNYTVKEHFIPQCYLGQFSPDEKLPSNKKNPFDKRHIWQYDVMSGIQTPDPVLIRNICYKKNLYEIKNEQGEYIYRNLIEKMYAVYDGHFADTFRSIRAKARCESNFRVSSILNNHEKVFILFFFSTLILRSPDMITAGIETAKELFGNEISDNAARTLTLQMCRPLFESLESKEQTILNALVSWFNGMSYQIGVLQEDLLLTSDQPLIIFGKVNPIKISKVFCPISPRVVIHMTPEDQTPKGCRNHIKPLSISDSEIINKEIILHCKRWIYSKQPLTDKQITMINKERIRL